MTQQSYDNIIYQKEGATATITLNRPEALNALSTSLLGEMHDALQDAEADAKIRVIVNPKYCQAI